MTKPKTATNAKIPKAPKAPHKPTGRIDAKRAAIADAAKDRLRHESIHVQRTCSDGSSGRERTLACAYVDGVAIDMGEIIVSAVAYDGTKQDVGRPVRLVLDLDDAHKLQAQLGLWVPALEGAQSESAPS